MAAGAPSTRASAKRRGHGGDGKRRHCVGLALGFGGCAQHPALVVGVTTGVIGFGACEVDDVRVSVCGATGAITGIVFGALTAIIYHFTDSSAHQLPSDAELGPGGVVRVHTTTPLPPKVG